MAAPVVVPTIDLSPWTDGRSPSDPACRAARAAMAAAVDDACRRVGFLQIVGHGVPDEVRDAMLTAVDGFFARPMTDKLALRSPSAEVNRGYAAPGSESLAYSLGKESPPDLFEAFNVGPDDPDLSDPAVAVERHRLFAANIWPQDGDGVAFRAAVNAWFAEARRVAHLLTDVFAAALGLPDGWFGPATDHSTDTLRIIHYHRGPDAPPEAPGQQWMGAHTDYGILTVLYADDVDGLEIIAPDNTWQPVRPGPGALLVNLGDLTAQWTNDRWRSTVHRVTPPSAPGPARRRSFAFFHDGNHDALVEVLPTCCDEANPPRYAPTTAGEHLMAKLLGPRTMAVSDAVSTLGDRTSVV